MSDVYALLVGVDAYRSPAAAPLTGCVNDIEAVLAYLTARPAGRQRIHPMTLCDESATRAAVIDAFRTHLGRGGAGDTALYWFSGHGSSIPVPREWARTEGTRYAQTTLCFDSRHDGVADLVDKELSYLIGEVAARGVHVVVVLDCCHADSGTRDAALAVRCATPLDTAPPLATLLPELGVLDVTQGAQLMLERVPNHVAMAACQVNESAYEITRPDGSRRGQFTFALLSMLARLGPTATYRDLMVGARCLIQDTMQRQIPALFPSSDPIVDELFLGGALGTRPSAATMIYAGGRWQVDIGACHAMAPATLDDPTYFGVYGTDPVRQVRVTEVLADCSVVAPVDWEPDETALYDVVLTRVPLPPTSLVIHGDAPTADRIAAALATIAPGDLPSPHLRRLDPDGPTELPDLRVLAVEPGVVEVRAADRTSVVLARSGVWTEGDAAGVVADLEHVARWRQIKALANPASRLGGAVRIDVLAADTRDHRRPIDGRPLRPDVAGAIVLDYRPSSDGWVAPTVLIKLRNTIPVDLFCVLLDLTDQYKIHSQLFDGQIVAGRYAAPAARGAPIVMSLPRDRAVRPGAVAQDWLMLLVSERPFQVRPFALPALGEHDADSRTRGALDGVLDRLGASIMDRAGRAAGGPAHDWATSTISLVTRVPCDAHDGGSRTVDIHQLP